MQDVSNIVQEIKESTISDDYTDFIKQEGHKNKIMFAEKWETFDKILE